MKPYFSIIVAYYNQMFLFEETFASILEQDEKDFEVIIINDGSNESNTKWLNNHVCDLSNVYVINQENKGPGTARNNGINNALGEFVLFLDSDDLMSPNCLSTIKKGITNGVDVVITDCEFFGVKNQIKRQYIPTFPQLLAYNNIIICAAIRKSFLGDDIRFEPKMDRIGLEDWEFWISVLNSNAVFHHLPEVLFKIRMNEYSRTTNTANLKKQEAFSLIYSKHSVLTQKYIHHLLVDNKAQRESLNTRIGDVILSPYRLLKKFLLSK